MAGWPFTNGTIAPDFEVGPEEPVTSSGSPSSVTSDSGWLIGAHFSNGAAAERTVQVRDGSGRRLCALVMPAGTEQDYEWAFRPFDGIEWDASGDDVFGHLWGYVNAP